MSADAEDQEVLRQQIEANWETITALEYLEDSDPSDGWFKQFEENWVYHIAAAGPVPAAQRRLAEQHPHSDHTLPAAQG